jgi:hypothetical protein
MLHVAQKIFGSLALVFGLLVSAPAEARQDAQAQIQTQGRTAIHRRIPAGARNGAVPFVRTELFFGTAKPDGAVTDEEFKAFVDAEITPRFPDGLTILKGDGQFRTENDVLIKEESFVLILLYPYETIKKSSVKIQRIRDLYKEQFNQESVLRVDDPYIVWVSF